MSSVSEVVEAVFSDGLDGDHRLELVTVIDLQVNDLLRRYLKARKDVAAQVVIMVKRIIGDLGSNLTSIQTRMSVTQGVV